MTTSAALKRRRDTATHCYYCHVVLTHNNPPRVGTDATIEHLNSRAKFPQGRPEVGHSIVIACQRCNLRQAYLDQRELGIEHLRALAGRWPSQDRGGR